MHIIINHSSMDPIYEQIVSQIKRKSSAAVFPREKRFPR